MKHIWLLIILVLFLQEPASTDAVIFQIRQLHLNLWLVNALWLIEAVLGIGGGYLIGILVQKRFQNTRFGRWSHVWAKRIEKFIGRRGQKFVLILLGLINFTYLNGLLASWLDASFKDILILCIIGDVVYWGIEWGINIWARAYFSNALTALYVVVGFGIMLTIFSKIILNRVLRD